MYVTAVVIIIIIIIISIMIIIIFIKLLPHACGYLYGYSLVCMLLFVWLFAVGSDVVEVIVLLFVLSAG